MVNYKEIAIFYTTAFFVLLAILSALSFCFLIPFVIDPAWSTLSQNFIETNCTTISGTFLLGRHNCSWTSCSEGCTKEIFNCWQIEVEYSPVNNETVLTENSNSSSGLENKRLGRLYPNVKGCGYPPRVDCSRFVDLYGTVGSVFPCYYSSLQPNLVITYLDFDEIYIHLLYSTVIPIPAFLISIFYIVFAYLYFYAEEPVQCSSTNKKSSNDITNADSSSEDMTDSRTPESIRKSPIIDNVKYAIYKGKNVEKQNEDRKIYRQQNFTLVNESINFDE